MLGRMEDDIIGVKKGVRKAHLFCEKMLVDFRNDRCYNSI